MVLFGYSSRAAIVGVCLLILISIFGNEALMHEKDVALYGVDCFVSAIQEIDRTWPLFLALAFIANVFSVLSRASRRVLFAAQRIDIDVLRDPPRVFLTELFSSGQLHSRVYA